MDSKGYKYKNIIMPLMLDKKKVEIGINKRMDLPHTMTLNNNKIAYIHWDNPNEIVDLLLEAWRQADHNNHDNEILSFIKELCETGLIINSV